MVPKLSDQKAILAPIHRALREPLPLFIQKSVDNQGAMYDSPLPGFRTLAH